MHRRQHLTGPCLSRTHRSTHVDLEVCMQKHLKLKTRLALVPHGQHRLQPIPAQRDAVHERKLVRPRLLRILTDLSRRQTEIERDRVIPALAQRAGLR
jgi:hypothetical protein